jgi:hypothetical protein
MEAAAAPGSDDAVAERIAGHCQFFDKMFGTPRRRCLGRRCAGPPRLGASARQQQQVSRCGVRTQLLHAGACQLRAELIPAKFYFNTDAAAARSALESKFSHNKKRKAPKQAVKEATTKAKKAKLNPDAHKSNRERLLQGAFAHEDALVDAADDSGKEGSGMDDLKQRLLIRVQELRKQRQATAHRKLNGEAAVKKQKTAPDKKQKRKKKPAAKAAAAGDDASDGAAGSAGAVEPGASGGKPNTNTNDFMFAAKIGQEDPRIKARRKKTDAALLKKAQHFDRTLQQADEDQRTELKESKEWEAALSRAEGSKVKDDVALLKKSIKRKEKSKEKSRKAWQKRLSDHDRRCVLSLPPPLRTISCPVH